MGPLQLVLIGKNLDLKIISNSLTFNWDPSNLIDFPRKNKPINFDHWEFTTQNKVKSRDLSDHLNWLLKKIEPKKEELFAIIKNNKKAHMYITCFWKPISGYGGPVLSPKILNRVANLDLELWIDFNP